MPMVRLVTNILDNVLPDDFEVRLIDLLSKSMGKPRERILVEVNSGARVTHGISKDPVVYLTITSIGAVSGEDNIRHTYNITKFCEEELNVPKNKVIITFHDASPTEIGFCGTTVANLMD